MWSHSFEKRGGGFVSNNELIYQRGGGLGWGLGVGGWGGGGGVEIAVEQIIPFNWPLVYIGRLGRHTRWVWVKIHLNSSAIFFFNYLHEKH